MRSSSFTGAAVFVAVAVWTLAPSPGTTAATEHPTRPGAVNRVSSRCDKECKDPVSRLCGTDDVTYDSFCLYLVASCKNKTLGVAYLEKCVSDGDGDDDDDNTHAPGTTVPMTKLPVTKAPTPAAVVVEVANDEANAQQVQAFEVAPVLTQDSASKDEQQQQEEQTQVDYCAIKCSSTKDFVCGSDGITYTNECVLLAAKCGNPKLKLASVGKCPAIVDKCAKFCTREYEPVCGSDGVTYGNVCTFAEANCRVGESLKVVAKCACPKPSGGAKCGGTKCKPQEKCIADKGQKGREYCAELCGASNVKNCKRHEVCVLHQVVCKKAPCLEQPSCVAV